MSPETLLTWAELRAALADPETLWLLGDARPLWLIPVLALLALGLPADRALAARGRNLAALSLRLVTLSLLLFAVAQPRIQRRVPDLAVVIAEDRSASMSPARLDDARALAARVRAGLPEGVPVVEVFDAPAEATDLTALLQRAVAAAPSARTRRVLLLTDGADRHGGAEGDAAARAGRWAEMVRLIHAEAAPLGGRYLEMRYEDLLADPPASVRRLLAFLGEPEDERVLRHLVDAYPGRPDRWRRELGAETRQRVEAVARESLATLGYEVVS